MLNIFKTLVVGASARAEEQLESKYSIELIRQKIRESETALNSAKATLVSLIQRQRIEQRQLDTIEARIKTLTKKAKDALKADREDLAADAAKTIADIENEREIRAQTLQRLDARIERLRNSLDQMSRRLVDLKQGEIAAKAYRNEANAQKGLNQVLDRNSSFADAESLIQKVMAEDDPFEQSEILAEVNADLSGNSIDDRMAEAGIGEASKVTANDVLARLKS